MGQAIQYINQEVVDKEVSTNEVHGWIRIAIRREAGPLYNFPQAWVEKAVAIAATPLASAEREFDHPLHSQDSHPVLHEYVSPKIMHLLQTKVCS